ncbi:MAG: hypothetical protein ACYC7D_07010 [Nitrososphaerales archaeon]
MKVTNTVIAFFALGIMLSGSFVPALIASADSSNPLQIRVIAPTLAYPGEKLNMFIETTYNGTLVGNATSVTFHAHMWVDTPTTNGSTITITFLPAPTNYATGHYNTTWSVPLNATMGSVEWVHVPGAYQGVSSTGVAGITIMPQSLFTSSNATISKALGPLQTQVNSLQQQVEMPSGQMIETAVTAVAAILGIIAIIIAAFALVRRPKKMMMGAQLQK